MRMLRCPACYQEVDENQERCPKCKTALVLSRDHTRFLFARNICSKCQTENPVDFRFCGKCGGRMTQHCSNCGFETGADISFCGRCGFELSGEDKAPLIDQTALPASVVVVDDEPYITKLLKHLLESEGMKVEAAGSVKEALPIIARAQPSLVITDMMMPEMDGYELIRQLRKSPETRQIKIIMLTVVDAFEEIRKSVLIGADDYLCKPFDPQELLWAVKRQLGRFHAWEGKK